MSDDLTQLDELIESDILEALGEPVLDELKEDTVDDLVNVPDGLLDEVVAQAEENEKSLQDESPFDIDEGEILEDIGDIEILPMAEIESALEEQEDEVSSVNLNNVNSSDLASLLSQLLNNKTIEITIKIKD